MWRPTMSYLGPPVLLLVALWLAAVIDSWWAILPPSLIILGWAFFAFLLRRREFAAITNLASQVQSWGVMCPILVVMLFAMQVWRDRLSLQDPSALARFAALGLMPVVLTVVLVEVLRACARSLPAAGKRAALGSQPPSSQP